MGKTENSPTPAFVISELSFKKFSAKRNKWARIVEDPSVCASLLNNFFEELLWSLFLKLPHTLWRSQYPNRREKRKKVMYIKFLKT